MLSTALKNGILVILLILTVHFLLKRYLLENRSITYKDESVDVVLPAAPIPPAIVTAPPILSQAKPLSTENSVAHTSSDDEIYNILFNKKEETPTAPTPPPPPPPKKLPSLSAKYCVVGEPEQKIEGFADLNAFDSFGNNYEEL